MAWIFTDLFHSQHRVTSLTRIERLLLPLLFLTAFVTVTTAQLPLHRNIAPFSDEDATLVRDHGVLFLLKKSQQPFIHRLPGSGILFQITKPAPPHLGRYCARVPDTDAAVEVAVAQTSVLGKSTGSAETNISVEPTQFRSPLGMPGWSIPLQRIPEEEEWRVYFPNEMAYRNTQVGEMPPYSTITMDIRMVRVLGGRMNRTDCQAALATELGYDPYEKDAALRAAGTQEVDGLEPWIYPFDGEEALLKQLRAGTLDF